MPLFLETSPALKNPWIHTCKNSKRFEHQEETLNFPRPLTLIYLFEVNNRYLEQCVEPAQYGFPGVAVFA